MDPEALKIESFFYGSATLGERGQIVIPAEARKDCDIHSGDKLLVFRHPMHPRMLILATIDEMQLLLQQMSRSLKEMEVRVAESARQEE